MKHLSVRIGSQLWQSLRWYGKAAGLIAPDGSVDISETVRDLLSRGLVQERGAEAGYRSGYREGKLAAYSDHMRRIATATSASIAPAAPRRK